MDNFFQFFGKSRAARPSAALHERAAGSAETTPDGGDISSKVRYVSDNSTALKVSAFYRGVSILGGSLSQMLMVYQKYNRNAEYFERDLGVTRGQRINYLLQVRPNRRRNAAQFWRAVMYKIILDGNAFILPRRDERNEIEDFILIDGSVSATVSGEYLVNDSTNGIFDTFGPDEILHIRNCYADPVTGMGIPTLSYAATALGISRTIEAQTLETSAKGGRLKLLLMRKPEDATGFMGRNSTKEMKKEAESLGRNIFSNDVNFIDGQFDAVNISMNAGDQQLFENRKFGIPEIARFLGIPPVLLFDYANSSYKSYSDSDIEYLSRSLAPIVNEIECEFNAKLIPQFQFGTQRYFFSTEKLHMMDESQRADTNLKRLQTGTASVNELRRQENRPRIAGGDEYYVSTNLAKVGSDKLGGKPAEGGAK